MACCCSQECPCGTINLNGVPSRTPPNPYTLAGTPDPITVVLSDGPSDINGSYQLTWLAPSSPGDLASNGWRWNYTRPSGFFQTINVRFRSNAPRCDSPICGIVCHIIIVADPTSGLFSSANNASNELGCFLVCGNVYSTFNRSVANTVPPFNSVNVAASLPTSLVSLP